MSSEPNRPEAYTPFLRRFTDEAALDLSETVALYDEVGRLHRASTWSQGDVTERISNHCAAIVGQIVSLPKFIPMAEALDRCQMEVIRRESTIVTFPEIDWSRARLSLKEQVDLRRFLRAKQHFLGNDERVFEKLVTALCNVFGGIITELPPLTDGSTRSVFTTPLITLLPDAGSVVDRIIGTICTDALAEAGLFVTLQQQLHENICRASGVDPLDEKPRKPLILAAQSELAPAELAAAYLKDTPFLDLFLCPVPFAIPDPVRFEHMHIVAGTGHGKTQTLQHLIMHDLSRAPKDVPSLVIVDSQGDMLAKIARLDLFNPDHGALADRLVLIDPTDIDHPPALGLFDINLSRVRGYAPRYREQIMNGVIELYDFIFGGLLGAELTQKQSVIFRYLARLMLAIPDATIITLKDVMYDSAPFEHHYDGLDGMARDFFRHEFNDKQFAETKKQILRRLWGILENPTFERLFSQPRNKLDMFDALNSGKIVLINTAKDFLKAERSSILGRFFIALTFQAAMERAALPEADRRPAFLYIDEAAEYFDDTIDSLLTQARKFNLGVIFAHQYLDQLRYRSRALEASIMTNTSIKLAGGVSSADAHALAPNMGTTHERIGAVRKRRNETEFAAYVRNVTPTAITLTVPFGTLEKSPRMSANSYASFVVANRRRYTTANRGAEPATAKTDQALAASVPVESTSVDTDDDWRS